MKFTKDQQEVIYTRDCDMLVSAAAGSGKTAVLVERIIQMITDQENPLSIDELLVVTFTHAAASEMAERISLAIENQIQLTHDQQQLDHLIKQLTLMSSSNIMTLHSFALNIIKEYYYLIDLDPKFRIGNETELAILKEDVLSQLLESHYETANQGFLELVECYAHDKDDKQLRDLIINLYYFAMSHPWPEVWMKEACDQINFESNIDIYESVYYQRIIKENENVLNQGFKDIQEIKDLMALEGGPTKYQDTFEVLVDIYQSVNDHIQNHEYEKIYQLVNDVSIPPLSRKQKGFDKELAQQAKLCIDRLKEGIKAFNELVLHKTTLQETNEIHRRTTYLVELVKQFMKRFQDEKREKNIIDFSDIEHFALQILFNVSDGETSAVALSYKQRFREVLVDEYQDINQVQEALLQGVSKTLFMVGDLKQSIYKFRLARPEIFRSKYASFEYGSDTHRKIDLSKNFRSRREVLDLTNMIFEKIMSLECGDVVYNDQVKLNYGASYYDTGLKSHTEHKVEEDAENKVEEEPEHKVAQPANDDTKYVPEIVIIENETTETTKYVKQAKWIGTKIHSLIDESFEVYDKSIGDMRPITFKDCCVLLRSPSKAMTDIKETFDAEHIPYVSEQANGYFDSMEVQQVLNVLRVIDNPFKEISLISVLRSPWIGLDENQLLEIREFKPDENFYDSLIAYADSDLSGSDELAVTLNNFLNHISELRDYSKLKAVDVLIDRIYEITGYKVMMGFVDGGQQRVINLEYLEMLAKQYNGGSSVYDFLRYVDHVKKYKVNLSEPPSSGAEENRVVIMSIHKSKGLEFPVVFLMDLDKPFNTMDLKSPVMFHQEYGISSDYISPDRRYKKATILSKVLRYSSGNELVSEEMRLFYVALTRAREKIYMLMSSKNLEKTSDTILNYYDSIKAGGQSLYDPISPYKVKKGRSFADFVMMTCCDFDSTLYQYTFVKENQLDTEVAFRKLYGQEKYQNILDLIAIEQEPDSKRLKALEAMEVPYVHQASVGKFTTLSVSDLKRQYQKDTEEVSLLEMSFEEKIPEFVEKSSQQGAVYGTLVHTVLAHLPLVHHTYESIQKAVMSMAEKDIISEEDASRVYIKSILAFTQSELYQRICRAWNKRLLFVEKSFVLKVQEEDDLQMVQGVIDGYFYEENEIVLYDYKSDQVSHEEELVEKYVRQLNLYKKALETITGANVKETYIYSLSLNQSIQIK